MASIKAKFSSHFKILKTDGPRGHNAQADKIVAKGRKQISILKAFKCEKIILMLDLEARPDNCDSFIALLDSEIKKHNLGVSVSFIVPNTMIENWYLADIEYLSKKKAFLKDNLKQKNYEGTHGKAEIKKLFKREYSYSETDHGPQMFVLIRNSVASKHSPSYKRFLLELGILT
jgi:hypothetical protein